MKYVTFYADPCQGERKPRRRDLAGLTQHNVFAAFTGNGVYLSNGDATYEGVGAAFDYHGSGVCGMGASLAYLRDRCTRISEAEARRLHPALFVILDREE